MTAVALVSVVSGGGLSNAYGQPSSSVNLAQADQNVLTLWVEFSSEEKAFSAFFPSAPVEIPVAPDPSAGIVEAALFVQSEVTDAGFLETYFVTVSEFAEDLQGLFRLPQAIDAGLDGCVDGFSEDKDNEILSMRDISLGRFPGREVELRSSHDGTYSIAQCFISEPFIYVVAATSSTLNEELRPLRSPSMDEFFNSFQLID